MPTPHRALPSVAVRFSGSLLLFDCGESTQRQLLASGLGLPQDFKIFITHRHPDHLLGVPGVLYTLSMLGRESPVSIFGPPSACHIIKALLESLKTEVGYAVEIRSVNEGEVYRGRGFKVEAARADHSTESLCYRVVENDRRGKMKVEYLERLGLPRGPLWGKLQRGENVVFQGMVIKPEDVVDPPRRGRRVVYTGDTRFSEEVVEFSRGADLLIHDSTFDGSLKNRAWDEGHSTTADAASVALRAQVGMLALFHISPRYHGREEVILNEARQIFPNTFLPRDLEKLEISYPE